MSAARVVLGDVRVCREAMGVPSRAPRPVCVWGVSVWSECDALSADVRCGGWCVLTCVGAWLGWAVRCCALRCEVCV